MGITQNPYGVGASGQHRERLTGRCDCCELPYIYERWPGGTTGPTCDQCRAHVPQPDEPTELTLQRARDHESRLRAHDQAATAKATEYEKELREIRATTGAQVASALRTRDTWRDVVTAVYQLHAERNGQCTECKKKAPCATIRLLDRQPRHISNYILNAATRRIDPQPRDDDW